MTWLFGTPEPRALMRFLAHISPPDTSECMLWSGARHSFGYGLYTVNKRCVGSHRVAFEWLGGRPIGSGMSVLHRCDNPRCVNPDHLFLGTQSDNVADKVAKGRQARGSSINPPSKRFNGPQGERSGTAKLTDEDVIAIRREYAAGGVTQRQLAERHGVIQQTIQLIVTGKRWAHLMPGSGTEKTTGMVTVNGRTMTMAQWARETGISMQTIWARRKRGWSAEAAVSTPTKAVEQSRAALSAKEPS